MRAHNGILDEVHGKSGEIPVQTAPYTGMAETFIKAGQEMGWPNIDLNGRVTAGLNFVR